MKQRCSNSNNTNYKNYGGRGISICDEWRSSFKAFEEWALSNGYEDNLTIDRIDVNGNYCPDNCRWITIRQQQRNKRQNIFVTMDGETLCMAEWEERYNIAHKMVWKRMLKGMTFEEAVKTPNPGKYNHIITCNGETHHLAEWSRITGIKENALRARLKSGNFTIEQAINESANSRYNRNISVEYNGETKSLREWSEVLGISYRTLTLRLFHFGYTIEETFTTPPRAKRKTS